MRKQGVFLVFHMAFSMQVVLARIYTFLLTEFTIQHITWHNKIILKLCGPVFRCKRRVLQCFLLSLLVSGSCFNILALFGRTVGVKWHMGGPAHYQHGERPAQAKTLRLLPKVEFQSNSGQMMVTNYSVFHNRLHFYRKFPRFCWWLGDHVTHMALHLETY